MQTFKIIWFFIFLIVTPLLLKTQPAFSQMHMVETKNGSFKVLIRESQHNNPCIIFVHGGPGYPLFPFLDQFKTLLPHFNFIFYEQRGTGKSYALGNKETMHLSTFIADLDNIVDWSRKKFDTGKIIIMAHSWGSNLGVLYASQYPDKVLAYIGTGQSVNPLLNERLCYRFVDSCARKNADHKALKTLKRTDTLSYSLRDALKIRKWVYKYGGIVYQNTKSKNYINSQVLAKVLSCQEYSTLDKWNLIAHSKYSGKSLWNEIQDINLQKAVTELKVPVFFMLGRHDNLVSSQLAKAYFDQLIAPAGKHLIWFENSAHRPMTEEPAEFTKSILLQVMPLLKK